MTESTMTEWITAHANKGYCGKHGYTFPRSEGCPVCRKECELEENNARSVPRKHRSESNELA